MWTNFTDLDRTFAALHALQRRAWTSQAQREDDAFSFSAEDNGDAWVVKAALPGVPKEAVEVMLTGQVLRLSATRKTKAPADGDDVVVHRQERPSFRFAKSITLPDRVDGEKVTATAQDGLFTITLPKAQDAKPRAITIR